MHRPIILVSPDIILHGDVPRKKTALGLDYQQAIADAGATPVEASPCADSRELFEMADGWLITGGDDLPPRLFGEDSHPANVDVDPIRFENETRLHGLFSMSSKPILGICMGAQFLNVMAGGSLIQHIPDVSGSDERKNGTTCVEVVAGSRLDTAGVPPRFEARCFHHQAIARIGRGWRIAARADDGIVEATESEGDHWRVGVQWHPERTLESEASQRLFAAFVSECAIRR